MARQKSAGLLLYRRRDGAPGGVEVLLVHPGGPFWRQKDEGAWSIPKGEVVEGEDRLSAARREVAEETGVTSDGPFRELPPARQKGGKVVYAWAAEGDCEPQDVRSNTFEMEWPPHSGRTATFPEVDRAAWFDLDTARRKLGPAQAAFIDALGFDPPT